ncbi:hypothetical protein PQO01_00995 [Lentisphaera marina]|uniref:hypothetical protein n=1 Tax=Lentisphaera marina TaxID=1111041 RepID=UPI002364FD13|nr:hypothetical protein [Lentisphaera marina]MDD7983524.1 hypothetical protein [Lentisphaera marina]
MKTITKLSILLIAILSFNIELKAEVTTSDLTAIESLNSSSTPEQVESILKPIIQKNKDKKFILAYIYNMVVNKIGSGNAAIVASVIASNSDYTAPIITSTAAAVSNILSNDQSRQKIATNDNSSPAK